MITNVILDFDGTIGDTCRLIVGTMQQTFGALGLPVPDAEECRATIGLPLAEAFAALLPGRQEAAACVSTYRELFARNNASCEVQLFPHVTETIAALHAAGKAVSVASSRQRKSLSDFLHKMRLERMVACIVASDDVERAKPAPDMVEKILRQTGGRPGEAIVVGDTAFDLEMGRSAGTLTCAVTYGNGRPEELAQADYVIDDFALLAGIVIG